TDPFTGTVVYSYDRVGNRIGLTYPDGKQVTTIYDDDNRLQTVQDWDSGTTSYEYDAVGRLITTTLPNNVQTVNAYDNANRLTRLTHSESDSGNLVADYQYELDKLGNRLTAIETMRTPTDWIEHAKLTASNGAISHDFGESVAIDGNTLIVGSPDAAGGQGAVYVFKRLGNNWIEQEILTASNGNVNDDFGESIDISGDRIVVGVIGDDTNGAGAGAVYVFEWDVNMQSWVETRLLASNGAAGDAFGYSVAVDNDWIVVGAINTNSQSGSAYVYQNQGGIWQEQYEISRPAGLFGFHFGESVAINNDTIIVGTTGDFTPGIPASTGVAYAFVWTGTTWDYQLGLQPSDIAAVDFFGASVAIEGNIAVVGSSQDDDNGSDSGSVYVFTRHNGAWSQQNKLIAADGAAGDAFGNSVTINNDDIVIGAYFTDINGNSGAGAAYVFHNNGVGWVQTEKLIANDGETYDLFGVSVALSNEVAVIGAFGDDDLGAQAGAAYVFANTQLPASNQTNNLTNGINELTAIEPTIELSAEPVIGAINIGVKDEPIRPSTSLPETTLTIGTQRVISQGRSLVVDVDSQYLNGASSALTSDLPAVATMTLGEGAAQSMTSSSQQGVIFPNDLLAATSSWTELQIGATVPANAVNGDVFVNAAQGASNGAPFLTGSSFTPDTSGQGTTWDTTFSGVINSNTTWSQNILLTGDVTINSGVTLTIDPGVTVFFAAGSDDQSDGSWTDKTEIHIHGTLEANGSEASPIYFASNAASPAVGDWGTLALRKDGDISLSHCMARHAEIGVQFIASKEGGGTLGGSIQNCTLSDNRTGIQMYGNPGYPAGGTLTINPTIAHNRIENNLDYGLRINPRTGYGSINITPVIQNNTISGNGYGVYLHGGSWWLGHVDLYASVRNNTIVKNGTAGITILADGSTDTSKSDTDVQPVIENNLLTDNNVNLSLLLTPNGSDGIQILAPTIQYNTIGNAATGILIDDSETYGTLNPIIAFNVLHNHTVAIDNQTQTSREIVAEQNYWGDTSSEWDAGAQPGDTNGTVVSHPPLTSASAPLLSRLEPGAAQVGDAVTLHGANFGSAPAAAAVMGEVGRINDTLTHAPKTIALTHSYNNPIVFAW
ncbi:MAG: hypothetical protein GY796_32110, partial [Chloroflexi bacterium]|nr:hypothetical protein [Chloroflexota bacterium]